MRPQVYMQVGVCHKTAPNYLKLAKNPHQCPKVPEVVQFSFGKYKYHTFSPTCVYIHTYSYTCTCFHRPGGIHPSFPPRQ